MGPAQPQDPAAPLPNQRPASVTSLLCEGAPYEDWAFYNKSKNRFVVVNLEHVLSVLRIDYTLTRDYFKSATEIILGETTWNEEYPSSYECSHTQIKPNRRNEPKHFGHAATTIVALELAAKEKNQDVNVYDWLRILPGWYFVDRFEKELLAKAEKYYEGLTEAERIALLGDDAKGRSFRELCLMRMDQTSRKELLDQVVGGACLTRLPADRLVDFMALFPKKFEVGPVLRAGEQSVSNGLGSKRTARNLHLPRRYAQDKLGPCR
jgi:hypothetical protein